MGSLTSPTLLSLFYLKRLEKRGEMIGIYKIENKVNGKVYVGQSIDIERRWYSHKTQLNGNRHGNVHLQNAWNKNGNNSFEFVIVENNNK